MDNSELVTLATYSTVAEATIVQNTLEVNDIRAFVLNGATATTAPNLCMPFYVRLQVPARDIETAQAVLKAIELGGAEVDDLPGGKPADAK